jgi:hypothetical protein
MTNSTTFPGSVTCPTSTVSNAMTLGTTKTFVVTVSDASGYNKYYIDGYLQASLELHQQQTYIFDLSSSTLSGHPFEFSTTNDGSHGGGSAYTTGITTTGTYASSEKRTFFVPVGAPTTLYYYCTAHSGMGAGVSISPTAELVVSGHIESTDLVVTGTGGVGLGVGTTAQRPSNPTTGMIRYNSTIGFMEAYTAAGWGPIAQPPAVTGVSPTTTLTSGGVLVGWVGTDTGPHMTGGTRIVADDGANGDLYGYRLAISGDGTKVIVGSFAEEASTGSGHRGAAYIYTLSGGSWSQTAKILAADQSGTNASFGVSVGMNSDGTKVVIGAQAQGGWGAAYIFAYNGTSWVKEGSTLLASDKQSGDQFGQSVSMNSDGTRVIAGAFFEDSGGDASGAAYVFAYNGTSWSQQAKLVGDNQAGDWFGEGVSMSSDGTRVIAGGREAGSYGIGFAYVFNFSSGSWDTGTKISPPSDVVAGDYLGQTVSISGDGTKVLIGAPADHVSSLANTGSAYVFTYNGSSWVQEVKLTAATPGANAQFGMGGVSMNSDGTKIIVGEYQDYGSRGAAHIFTYSSGSWDSGLKIVPTSRATGAYFGCGVAINSDGTRVIVGEHENGAGKGAAYIFDYNSNQIFDSSTQVFTATGSGIIPGSTVQLEGADGTLYSVFNTTTPNAAGTQVTFKMGALGATGAYTVANQPYKIRVNSTSGLSGTSTTPLIGLAVGWTTAAGADLTFTTESTTTQTLVGTDGAGGTNRKFEVAPSSASLPAGLTLTESTGAITGTITESAASGSTSVTFRLTDIGSGLFTDRAINIVWNSDAYTFSPNPFTFTNAGLYGRDGPDLAATKTAYGATGWWQTSTSFNQVSGKQGFQLWTVPSTGTYTIEAKGAQGGYRYTGSTYNSNNTAVAPGNGATVKATFALTKGATVVLIVAQSPARGQHWASGIGGGGASWVLKPGAFTSNNDVYLVAGGGGGSGAANYVTSTNQGGHAVGDGQGTLGSGGASGDRSAGGGAGWTGDGSGSYQTTYYYGLKPSNGALGGNPYHATHYTAYRSPGGFGGGGSNGGECSGGGAGAAGGRGATSYLSGNTIGGTSYIMPNGTGGVTVTARTFSGNHTDIHGSIIITQN